MPAGANVPVFPPCRQLHVGHVVASDSTASPHQWSSCCCCDWCHVFVTYAADDASAESQNWARLECGRRLLASCSAMHVSDVYSGTCGRLTQQTNTHLGHRSSLDLVRSDRFLRTTDCRRRINCYKIENKWQIGALIKYITRTWSDMWVWIGGASTKHHKMAEITLQFHFIQESSSRKDEIIFLKRQIFRQARKTRML